MYEVYFVRKPEEKQFSNQLPVPATSFLAGKQVFGCLDGLDGLDGLAGVWMQGGDHYADYQLPLLSSTALHFDHCTRSATAAMSANNCVRHCARRRVCAVDGKAAKRKHISNSL